MRPGGIRLGLCAMTTRGCKEDEALEIGNFLDKSLKLSLDIQQRTGKLLKDFRVGIRESEEVKTLSKEIEVIVK